MVLILNVLLIYSLDFMRRDNGFQRKSYFFMCPEVILLIVGYKWIRFMKKEWYWFPTINSSMNMTYHHEVVENVRPTKLFGGYGLLCNSQPHQLCFLGCDQLFLIPDTWV